MEFMKHKEKEQAQLRQNSSDDNAKHRRVQGPIFISIGNVDQLKLFLDQNPNIPQDKILVDDYDHNSYKKTMGFTRFDEVTSIAQLKELNLSKLILPLLKTLGISKLVTYVANVPALAPLEGKLDWTDLPEGGLRNGGTLVLGGGMEQRVIYRWNDKIPGDVPDPKDVYQSAETSS